MKKTIAALAMLPALSMAGAIDTYTGVISGDIRSPDTSGAIDITVDGLQRVGDESIFDFDVDFSAAMRLSQPTAKLQQFYFNVDPDTSANWNVGDLSAGWTVDSPSTAPGAGAGSLTFTYGLDAPGGGVTEGFLPLEFSLQLLDDLGVAAEIMSENFLDAATFIGDGGSGQLGAKVGGLIGVQTGALDLSGFGYGNHQVSCNAEDDCVGGTGGPDPTDADAPGMVGLLSLGLIGLFVSRRRNRLGMA